MLDSVRARPGLGCPAAVRPRSVESGPRRHRRDVRDPVRRPARRTTRPARSRSSWSTGIAGTTWTPRSASSTSARRTSRGRSPAPFDYTPLTFLHPPLALWLMVPVPVPAGRRSGTSCRSPSSSILHRLVAAVAAGLALVGAVPAVAANAGDDRHRQHRHVGRRLRRARPAASAGPARSSSSSRPWRRSPWPASRAGRGGSGSARSSSLSVPFGLLWFDWIRVLLHAPGGLLYSVLAIPGAVFPIFAWMGRRRRPCRDRRRSR